MKSFMTNSRASRWSLLKLIMMALFMLGGCTTVHINSKPSGADVMASYGGNFSWTEWGRECQTPCTFTSAHGVQLRIRWSDGTLSEIRQGDYHPFGATYDFNFDKSATTSVISMKNDINTSKGKLEQVQQASAPTTVAQITSKATEELQTFTGEVKIIEVRHFMQVDGLGISQEFINSFYDNMRERLAKNNVAGQIIDEGSAVPDAIVANTLIVEGKFTEYKKGGFLEGVGIVGSEIKFYRKSDHALIKIITPRVPFKPSPLNSDSGLGRSTGYKTADEIKKALR
jgi:hypothetical protein